MTLLDAKQYHPEMERRRRSRIVGAIVLVLVLAAVGWFNRFWPEKHVADKFFSELQKQDFEAAYGIYYHDPDWKQHPQNHAQYQFNEFKTDWGPVSYTHLDVYKRQQEDSCATNCKKPTPSPCRNGRGCNLDPYWMETMNRLNL